MDEDVIYVIPTASRDKVAYTHSYPIGAEALSKAFADVPQVREFQLAFSAGRFSISPGRGLIGPTMLAMRSAQF